MGADRSDMDSNLQERTRDLDRSELEGRRLDFDEIPVVDIAGLFSSRLADRRAVAARISEVCRTVGFMYIGNHRVPERLIEGIYREADAFFALPLEEKLRWSINKIKRHRGYVGYGDIAADPHHEGGVDLQEAYEVSLELPADDPDYLAGNIMYGPNVWPDQPAGFHRAVYDYYEAVLGLGAYLYRGFALALDMPEDYFADKVDKPVAQLRVVYYPPVEGPVDPRNIGVGAHTDYECFTILHQQAPGLQVRNRAGDWVEAPPIPGTFVVNIGDMMERWTNDLYASTVHRVINTSGRKRFALPLFFGANYDTVVNCLETCQGPDNPPRYPPTRAGDWTVDNISAVYAYRK